MVIKKKGLPIKGSRLLRTGRWSFPGYSYFITASTYNHLPIFEDPAYCDIVFDSMDWLEREKGAQLYCSVIMPNHIHLVVEPGPEQMLSQLMQSLKGYTARKINTLRGQTGHIWQDQYYDHLIRNEEDLRNIILYCYENPVRRNLVQDARDYPFWRCKFSIE